MEGVVHHTTAGESAGWTTPYVRFDFPDVSVCPFRRRRFSTCTAPRAGSSGWPTRRAYTCVSNRKGGAIEKGTAIEKGSNRKGDIPIC